MAISKVRSRAQLSQEVDVLKKQVIQLTACVYWQRKILTYLEYTRSTSGFMYVPLTNSILSNGNAGTHRSNAPGDYSVPSLQTMVDTTMVDRALVVVP
jgi:hypothetical protein